jgi:hypothetical protein
MIQEKIKKQQQQSRNREQRSILHQDTIKQKKLALGTPHINPNWSRFFKTNPTYYFMHAGAWKKQKAEPPW